MSYYIKLHFKELKEGDDVFKILEELKIKHLSSTEQIFENNRIFIPSIRQYTDCFEDMSESLHERRKHLMQIDEIDERWMKDILVSKVFYWKKFNLLGVTSLLEEIEGFKSVEFQDSSDQNYDFEDWKGIQLFEDIYKAAMKTDVKRIAKEENCNVKDVSERLDYYRKSYAYDKIWKTLDIAAWIGTERSKVVNILDISYLSSVYETAKQFRILKEVCKEYIEERKNE